MKNCIFCRIAQHKISSHVVYEDNFVIAFLDTDPITDGHTIVIPKKDVRDIHNLDKKTGSQLMNVIKDLSSIIEKEFNFDGIEIRAVSGTFQDVPHFHMHVFGRNKANDIKIKYPEGINHSPEHLAKIAKIIRNGIK